MLKRAGPGSITYLAYVLLLLAFVLLGVFVAALAHESGFAAVPGRAWSRLWPRPSRVSVLAPQNSLGRAKRLARLTN